MSTVIGIYRAEWPTGRLVGTASLDRHGQVVIDGDEPHPDRFLRDFLCPAGPGRRHSITDGEPWLAALPYVAVVRADLAAVTPTRVGNCHSRQEGDRGQPLASRQR
jgi:hypothetical protein